MIKCPPNRTSALTFRASSAFSSDRAPLVVRACVRACARRRTVVRRCPTSHRWTVLRLSGGGYVRKRPQESAATTGRELMVSKFREAAGRRVAGTPRAAAPCRRRAAQSNSVRGLNGALRG